MPVLVTALLACSALLIMLVRAQHDPPINQANPSTLAQLGYAVARKQYAVQGLWPRQVPWWLQIANWFEYADWQVALSLAPTVIPTISRTLITIAFAALALFGARVHRKHDARTWRAVALLFACGSLGVIAYLNLKAGTSFAWQFLPNEAQHEARDRDYFFVLSFWAWGIWAGIGAVGLARRFHLPSFVGVLGSALPIALNAPAVNRRPEPEASMPAELARSLLDPLSVRAVLFVAGDNDTYPLWYSQQVERRRADVTVVTMPLMAAPWYLDELARRSALPIDHPIADVDSLAALVASAARARGRQVAVSLTVPASDRNRLSQHWRVIGLVALDQSPSASRERRSQAQSPTMQIDTPAVKSAAMAVEAWRRGRYAHPAPDPVHEYFLSVLECPRLIIAGVRSPVELASLDSLCNLR